MSLSGELRLRLGKVRAEMGRTGLSALYSSDPKDVLYLSGRDSGRVLVTGSEATLWVRDIYSELYDSTYSLRGYPLKVRAHSKEEVKAALRGLRSRAVGVSSAGSAESVRKTSGKRVVVSDAVRSARAVKTRLEIECISRSCRMAIVAWPQNETSASGL